MAACTQKAANTQDMVASTQKAATSIHLKNNERVPNKKEIMGRLKRATKLVDYLKEEILHNIDTISEATQ